jgi:hypothetical protein
MVPVNLSRDCVGMTHPPSEDLPEEVNPHMETHGIVVLITTILTLIAYRVW